MYIYVGIGTGTGEQWVRKGVGWKSLFVEIFKGFRVVQRLWFYNTIFNGVSGCEEVSTLFYGANRISAGFSERHLFS